MGNLIRFEFATEQERDEFLLLNDLHLAAGPAPARELVLDLSGNRVGETEGDDPLCRVSILPEYRSAVRTTDWWHASCG